MIQQSIKDAVLAGRAGISLKEYKSRDWRLDDLHIVRLINTETGMKGSLFRDIWHKSCFISWQLTYLLSHAQGYAKGNKDSTWDKINQSIAKVVIIEPFQTIVKYNNYLKRIEFKLMEEWLVYA